MNLHFIPFVLLLSQLCRCYCVVEENLHTEQGKESRVLLVTLALG
jgi:hypothetical protein